MKIAAQAGDLHAALSLAALAADRNADTPAQIIADNGSVAFTCTSPQIAITTTAPATILDAGEIAVSASRLSALLTGFPSGATIDIATIARNAVIGHKGSSYRLPLCTEPPAALGVDREIGRIELPADHCLRLLSDPLPAVSLKADRLSLCGVYWHNDASRLIAVGIDGTKLLRTSVPAGDFAMPGFIIPVPTASLLMRLLRQIKPTTVMLRRSRTVLSASGAGFQITSALIDATFPDYARVIPEPSGIVALCPRKNLIGAIDRLAAIGDINVALVAMTWRDGEPLRLYLVREPDSGSDIIAAETHGTAQIVFALHQLRLLFAEFSGERVRVEIAPDRGLTIIQGVKTGVLVSCRWNFKPEEAPAVVA